nr:reverse transcriptase domain-containing protein [Tanacetum cinerariifolium]
MVDQRTMAQLLQAPTEGYEGAIVVLAITADNFELKHGPLTLVQNNQFFGHDKEDPHAHIRYFNKITSTLKLPNVSNTSIKLMLFPFSLEGAAWIWLEKEPPRSIFTLDDLVLKFINQFFPPSKTTNLHNEITNFQHNFDESFSEAWDRFKDLLRACPHHGFSELHQLDTFYNALNSKDQDSLNSIAGGNFLDKMPRECLAIIESKSKVHYSRKKPVVAKVGTNTSTSSISPNVAELKDMVKALLLDKKSQSQAPATVKAVKESFNYNQGNTSYRPSMMSNQIRPPGFPPIPNNQNVQVNQRNNQNHFNQIQNQGNNFNHRPVYQPSVLQPPAYQAPSYQASAPQTQVSAPRPNQRPSIPYPSKLQDQKFCDKANDQCELTLRVGKEAITFNLNQTSRYSANYNDMTAKRIDVIDMASEEYSQEFLGFFDVIASGNPTPYYDLIVYTTSSTLAPFENSDFLLEEVDSCLALEDDPTSPEVDQSYLDFEGDILVLEAFLNDDPSLPPLNKGIICLKFVELKDLPPHLEYAFLEGDDKLPVIITKDLSVEEKTALITVLKSQKQAIAWKLSISRLLTLNFVLTKFSWKRTSNQQSNIREELETDTQEIDKNKAKNNKTKHKVEKIEKDKVNRSRKSKVKALLKPKNPTPPLAYEFFNPGVTETACPHHGFSELHQLDTFYNALNVNDQDSLNSTAGGNFLHKMPRECLKIIESKSKVRQSRAKAVVAKVFTSSSTPAISSDVAKLKDMVKALLLDKKNQSPAPTPSTTPAPVKAVEPNCVTCGGAHAYQNCPATHENAYRDNIQDANTASSSGSVTLPGNTITNPKEELKGITTRSGIAYQGPKTPSPSKQGTKVRKDQVQTPSSQNTAPVQPSVIQAKSQASFSEPVVAPVSAPMPNLKPSIPYHSRRDNEKRRDQANEQIKKFYEIFKDISFKISFTDSLILMPKFASSLKALIGNKEKLSEMARTTMNEHCSVVILNKFPRKLGDPDKFLILCEFSGMDECLALADLGASINLMPLSVWEGLSLPELTPTCMTLELADRSVSKQIVIAKDVSFKVGVFHFPADFVVVDFEPDPRVPLILGRCFLKTNRALIDVHKEELTLRIGNEAITYNLDQTVRYSANYNQMTTNKIDVIESACEEYSQEVLIFSNVTTSGTPTPQNDPIVYATSPTLTLFGDSDFLLFEEADAFLDLEDDPDLLKINPFYYDPEGDILLLEAILNSKPSPPLPNQEQNMPSLKEELKAYEAQTFKSSVDEPPEVELKDLPHHQEYVFLEGDNKLPVIIGKELRSEEKAALIKV